LSLALRRARSRVPASTSNLGAGFDCVGLALDRYLEARFDPGGKGLGIVREGTLAPLETPLDDDLVVRAFRDRLAQLGVAHPDGTIHTSSEIPVARGLGSSAAALVAGHVLADAAAGQPPDQIAAASYAATIEGHGDNAGPCALGGLVGATEPSLPGRPDGQEFRAFRLPLSQDIGFAYAAPPVDISTRAARHALPKSVPFGTAVHSIRALTALLHGLATGDRGLLRFGFTDFLHVPHRLRLIPGAAAAMDAAEAAGAWAVTISGSGSGLIAVCSRGDEARVAIAMGDAFAEAVKRDSLDPSAVLSFVVAPDLTGAQILEP
jgi:homoserine kinase